MNNNRTAEKCKQARKAKKMTQKEVSEKAQMSLSAYRAFESGSTMISPKTLHLITKALDADVQSLMGRQTKVISLGMLRRDHGKSMTAMLLLKTLASMNYKVLAIDTDHEMKLTRSFGVATDSDSTLYQAVVNQSGLQHLIRSTQHKNIDLIHADHELAMLNIDLLTTNILGVGTTLARLLQPIIESEKYDFILMDTDDQAGLWSVNVLMASDYVLIPITPDMKKLGLISSYARLVHNIRTYHTGLKGIGVAYTVPNDTREVANVVSITMYLPFYPAHLYETLLPLPPLALQAYPPTTDFSSSNQDKKLEQAGKAFTQEFLSTANLM